MLYEPVASPFMQTVQKRTLYATKPLVKISARALIEPDVGKRELYEPPVREGEVGRAHGCVHTAWFYLSSSFSRRLRSELEQG